MPKYGRACSALCWSKRTLLTTCGVLAGKVEESTKVIGYVCVVTLHDYTTDTNDNMTTKTDFHAEHINTNT